MAGLRYAGIVLLVIAATMAVTEARTIIVGGSENWRFATTRTGLLSIVPSIWMTNLFKFDAPHDVYLLPNLYSYLKCDFRGAKLLTVAPKGTGEGFEVVLDPWSLYYFVSSSDRDCSDSLMKFFDAASALAVIGTKNRAGSVCCDI